MFPLRAIQKQICLNGYKQLCYKYHLNGLTGPLVVRQWPLLKEYYKEIYSQEDNSTISEDNNQLYKWSFRKVEFFKHLSLKLNSNYTRSMVTHPLVLIFLWILLIFEHFDAKYGNPKKQIICNKTKKCLTLNQEKVS